MLFPTVAGGVTQKMNSLQLRNLCKPAFFFPADPSLSLADAGKIVVNVNGKAKVASAHGSIPGTPGKWNLNIGQQITAPKQAAYTVELMANPAANDTFTLFADTWTFVSGLPATPFQIQLGSGHTETMANLRNALNDYGDSSGYYSLTAITDAVSHLTAGSHFPGAAGKSPGFSSTFGSLHCAPLITGVDGDLNNLSQTVLKWQKNGTEYLLKLQDICSASAPAGIPLLGYRWPGNGSEQEQNLAYALNADSHFTDHFSLSALQVSETVSPTGNTYFFSVGAYFGATESVTSEPGVEHYVPDVVLGQLMSVYEGDAVISTDSIFRARLAPDSAPVVFASSPADLFSRALMYGDDGTVTAPVPFADYPDLSFFGNGFLAALEEGNPGDTIWVRTFLFPAGG